MAAGKKSVGSRGAASKRTASGAKGTSARAARTAASRKTASRKTAAKKRTTRTPVRRVARREPETLRLRSASAGFTVNDIHDSLAFYRDVLGFTEKERWEEAGVLRGVELLAGSVSLWISQDDWKKGRDRVKGQGFRLYCSTSQDVDALAAQIKARGGALAEEPRDQPWGGRAFAVVDPDGFVIMIATEG